MDTFDLYLAAQRRRLKCSLTCAVTRAQEHIAQALEETTVMEIRGVGCGTANRPYGRNTPSAATGGYWGYREWTPVNGYQTGMDRGR